MSRVTDGEHTSGEDGEGEESVHGVVAQQSLLPVKDGLSLFFTDGLLWNQEKKHKPTKSNNKTNYLIYCTDFLK